jgi:hypothetical protein
MGNGIGGYRQPQSSGPNFEEGPGGPKTIIITLIALVAIIIVIYVLSQ